MPEPRPAGRDGAAAPASGSTPPPPPPAGVPTPAPWPRRGSEPGPDLLVCRARFDRLENPRTGREMRRMVLETPDWVNVVALTPERRLVLVRQYRFGPALVTTEVPGGVIDPGEGSREAAERELREETGYAAETWRYLGCVEPNPAFHDNLCHHWLALGARPASEVELDPGEDIAVCELDERGVREELASGRMRHSLVVSALCRVLDLRDTDPWHDAAPPPEP